MDELELLAQIERADGELARRHLKDFMKLFWPQLDPVQPFIPGYHIDAICEHLEHIQDIKNLLINVPPGFTKSKLVNVYFFCWSWLQNPALRFLYASHTQRLAERDSDSCRDILKSPLWQRLWGNRFQLKESQDTKAKFANDKTGTRFTTSIGGTTTGERGNIIVVDDPMDADDRFSDTVIEAVNSWFTGVFYNRVLDYDRDCRIVIMQRLAQKDLSGFIIQNFSDWEKLILPVEYDPRRICITSRFKDWRTEPGELLCPERMSRTAVDGFKQKMTARDFSAQYNQNPVDSEEQLFREEDFRTYQDTGTSWKLGDSIIDKSACFRLLAGDLAISQASGADYTAFVCADVTPFGDVVVHFVQRERISGTKLVPTIQALNGALRPSYVLVEDVAFQRLLVDELKLKGLAVRGIRPEKDKVSRSISLQVRMKNHQVYFPQAAEWLPDLKAELLAFGTGQGHDDMVDALAYLVIEANQRLGYRREPEIEEIKTAEQLEREEAQRWHEMVWGD